MISYALVDHIKVTPAKQMRSPSNSRSLLKNLMYDFRGDTMSEYEEASLLLPSQFYILSWMRARSTATGTPLRSDSSIAKVASVV